VRVEQEEGCSAESLMLKGEGLQIESWDFYCAFPATKSRQVSRALTLTAGSTACRPSPLGGCFSN
jgi:hypothetical protein